MGVYAELELMDAPEGATSRWVVGAKSCIIGRSPSCDYMIDRNTISREHASIWLQGDKVQVRDLRSRNGTFVNDARVETAELHDGDVLKLGSSLAFKVHVRGAGVSGSLKRLALEDSVTGHRFPLGPLPVRVGQREDCDIRLPDGPDVAGVFVSPTLGEAWFGTDDDMLEVAPGQRIDVGQRSFRIVEIEADPGQTMAEAAAPWPYRVKATLDAEGGPVASVDDTHGRKRHQFVGTNRAVLLYLLARRWSDDAEAGVEPDEVGWCADDDLAVGLWGRDGAGRPIKVLVCRLRAELREAGFDQWFVEKRRGALRIRVLGAQTY